MIKRFLLLSFAAHAAFAWMGESPTPVRLPAPELRVSFLSTASLSQREQVARESKRQRTTNQEVDGKRKTIQKTEGTKAAISSATMASSSPIASHADIDNRHTNERANHLIALIRSAFDQCSIYPPLARRRGWEGRVSVGLILNTDGNINALHIVRSSGHAILDQDALATFARIGTLPQARALLQGRPYHLEMPVLYKLNEG